MNDINTDVTNAPTSVQLSISMAQLRYIVDTIATPIFIHDQQFRVLLANQAYSQAAHKTEADILGQPYWRSFPLRDGPLPGCLAATNSTEKNSLEETLIDGQSHLSQGIVVRDEAGKFLYAFHSLDNISPLRASEEQLASSEANLKASDDKFQYFFDHSPIGKSITQLTGEIEVNQAFCDMLGYTKAELIHTKWQDISHPDDLAVTQENIHKMLSGQQNTARFIKRYFRKDGEVIWADISTALRNDASGKPLYLMTSIIDISQHKKDQAAILKLNAELEQRVAERTDSLKQANEELESFAYSVSHDLRVPLRAVDGFSQQILKRYEDKLDDEGKRYVHIVRDNALKMAHLIDDILAFSRTSRLPMTANAINMNELAQSVLDELAPSTAGRQITTSIQPLPDCQGDAAMVRQVWMNLLSNAIKFTKPQALATINISAEHTDTETIYCIKDNGAGFDMRYADKLFGVFQRLHGVDEFEGTGIGLAIVKRIINRHGGRVWAEGKVKQGATFYFSLPNQPRKPS